MLVILHAPTHTGTNTQTIIYTYAKRMQMLWLASIFCHAAIPYGSKFSWSKNFMKTLKLWKS